MTYEECFALVNAYGKVLLLRSRLEERSDIKSIASDCEISIGEFIASAMEQGLNKRESRVETYGK